MLRTELVIGNINTDAETWTNAKFFSSILFLISLSLLVYVCVRACACVSTCHGVLVKVRRQLCELSWDQTQPGMTSTFTCWVTSQVPGSSILLFNDFYFAEIRMSRYPPFISETIAGASEPPPCHFSPSGCNHFRILMPGFELCMNRGMLFSILLCLAYFPHSELIFLGASMFDRTNDLIALLRFCYLAYCRNTPLGACHISCATPCTTCSWKLDWHGWEDEETTLKEYRRRKAGVRWAMFPLMET